MSRADEVAERWKRRLPPATVPPGFVLDQFAPMRLRGFTEWGNEWTGEISVGSDRFLLDQSRVPTSPDDGEPLQPGDNVVWTGPTHSMPANAAWAPVRVVDVDPAVGGWEMVWTLRDQFASLCGAGALFADAGEYPCIEVTQLPPVLRAALVGDQRTRHDRSLMRSSTCSVSWRCAGTAAGRCVSSSSVS
jgi:hypothetical protein